MTTLPILVVEDDPNLREAICDTLELAGETLVAVDSGPAAMAVLDSRSVGIVVSDVRMEPMDGITLLKSIRSRWPHLPVVLMTAFADVDRAVEAMRSGACDFLMKPFEPQALLAHIARYRLPDMASGAGMVAADAASRNLFSLAARVAQTDATVLLTGESGVGKEVVARYIHRNSARRDGPFVAINCAAIPDSLLEATLFGYEKGAFTGATQAQAGKFEQAEHGTLLLDEVTEMPLSLQAKLLRVLQEREVERVGGKKPVSLDIRVVATSNRDMAEAVAKGIFREDLYYRLNVFPLPIPSLRQRRADIVPLARHFLADRGGKIGRPGLSLTPAAEHALIAHEWPGNIRELENIMQRAMILAPADRVDVEHLHLPVRPVAQAVAPVSPVSPVAMNFTVATGPIPRGEPFFNGGGLEANDHAPFGGAILDMPVPPGVSTDAASGGVRRTENMRDLEREHILETLQAVGGSRKLAVERLGISERTLRHKLKQYREAGFLKE